MVDNKLHVTPVNLRFFKVIYIFFCTIYILKHVNMQRLLFFFSSKLVLLKLIGINKKFLCSMKTVDLRKNVSQFNYYLTWVLNIFFNLFTISKTIRVK